MRREVGSILACALALTACSADDPPPAEDGSSSGSTGSSSTSTSDATAAATSTSGSSTGPGSTGGDDTGTPTVEDCFADAFMGPAPLPNYDQFGVVPGSHCRGTNHQDITGVERVVFLGDSVTVGTPPTASSNYYRARVADGLIERFDLDPGDALAIWKSSSFTDGTSDIMTSGAFWSCSEWGARNDDFLSGGNQIETCFPEDTWDQRTLVIVTMGGNDLLDFAQQLADGVPYSEVQPQVETMVQQMRDAVHWLTDPERFPAGNLVVFSNVYEFTDGTADFLSCPLAASVGFTTALEDPTDALLIVGYIEEQYAKIAAETGTDMIFMFEDFCGHGFHAGDPASACYRGPDAENWFDGTCIHPNSIGHGVIAEMFLAVIDE